MRIIAPNSWPEFFLTLTHTLLTSVDSRTSEPRLRYHGKHHRLRLPRSCHNYSLPELKSGHGRSRRFLGEAQTSRSGRVQCATLIADERDWHRLSC